MAGRAKLPELNNPGNAGSIPAMSEVRMDLGSAKDAGQCRDVGFIANMQWGFGQR